MIKLTSDRDNITQDDQPLFTISIAAETLKVPPQKLRIIENEGLVTPRRTSGQTRLYSRKDIEKMRLILRLMDDLGLNMAGVEVVLNMREHMRKMQNDLVTLMKEFVTHLERAGELDSKALMPRAMGMLLRMTQYIEKNDDSNETLF